MTWRVEVADCVEAMRAMPEASIDAVVCDPPYGLGFMGKEWDTAAALHLPPSAVALDSPLARTRTGKGPAAVAFDGHAFQAWCETWAREALRVLKPGGFCLAFGGTRTYHRLACAIEDAGFEVRDTLAYMYGSGFPKSLDVSKAIDKAAGAERQVVGPGRWTAVRGISRATTQGASNGGEQGGYNMAAAPDETAPASPDAEQWQGWGTALKPAHEPIVVARKPLTGTVAANVLAHGTGALNVDGCRVVTDEALGRFNNARPPDHNVPDSHPNAKNLGRMQREAALIDNSRGLGRWPANVILDEQAAAMLDEQTGPLPGGIAVKRNGVSSNGVTGWGTAPVGTLDVGYGDSGGASRFFYVAKASSAERNAGLDNYACDDKICGCLDPKDPAVSLPKAISEHIAADDSDSSINGSGSSTMDPCQTVSKSTISTATSQTTGSTISNSSAPSITSARILPTTGATQRADGSDAVPSVANGSLPTPSTTTSAAKAGPSTADADPATSGSSSSESNSARCANCGGVIEGGRVASKRNVHPLEPTVKPIELMRWLVRLVTPPGGTVLDPFTGSGTTGCAAVLEGFDFVGCEREQEYADIARARIAWWEQHPEGVEIVKALEADRERKKVTDAGQMSFLDG